jgi:fructan beta-fructosidase
LFELQPDQVTTGVAAERSNSIGNRGTSALIGKEAIISTFDQHISSWEHHDVAPVVPSGPPRQAPPALREMLIEKRYLHIPVQAGASKPRVKIFVDNELVRQFDIELATSEPSFWAFLDVNDFRGRRLTIDAGVLMDGRHSLAAIVQSNDLPGDRVCYREPNRPQFHFTSRRGWLNDPNGLVYYRGEWHLFYQHNPYGWEWGNMHWGHAVSDDLLHWRELPAAFVPWKDVRGACFSGSAVVDAANTSGFKTGAEDPIVAVFTDTGAGEVVAASNDRGRTWKMHDGNPVVRHRGRDPKIIWHAPSERWIMAAYEEIDDAQNIAFYSSPNLKQWRFESRIDGFYECPDLFALAVDGNPDEQMWVLYEGDGRYLLGDFDGQGFHPKTGKQQLWYGDFYAAQTYSDAPNGRRVQVGWGRGISFPGMPFNQQMTIPVDLTLRSTADGACMFAEPVTELESLRRDATRASDLPLENEIPQLRTASELLDIEADFIPGSAQIVGVRARGRDVLFDVQREQLATGSAAAPLRLQDGRIRLRILVDRGSLEVFGNNGQVAISRGVSPQPDDDSVTVFARGGPARLEKLTIYALDSVW